MELEVLLSNRSLVEVGNAGDPDRRLHATPMGPLAIRKGLDTPPASSRSDNAPPDTRPLNTSAIFITLGDLLGLAASGAYYRFRLGLWERTGRDPLRPPYAITGRHTADLPVPNMATPVAGLNWDEANAFATLLAGRMPSQKELDYILSHRSGDIAQIAPAPSVFWTASLYGLFDYSYCRCLDHTGNRWIADEHVAQPAPENEDQFTVILQNNGLTRRPVRRDQRFVEFNRAELNIFTLVVFDGEAA